MNVVSINPWQIFDELQKEGALYLDRAYNRNTNRAANASCSVVRTSANTSERENTWQPNIDILESDTSFVVSVDLPGIDPKEVDIQVEDNTLKIKGKRTNIINNHDDDKEPTLKSKRQERVYGKFSRSFSLPEDSDQESIKADFNLGVLDITIEKKAKAQPKKISIQTN